MTASLAEIRKRLQDQENRQSNAGGGGKANATFPFWNMPDDTTSVIRFLPDENPDNPYFWTERQVMKIPFSGIKGHDEHKSVIVQVPCIETWGEKCPVHEELRTWFKDPTLEDLARKYWKKRSYFFQGFVVDSSLKEDEPPENPIRKFIINPSIFKLIKSALMDPDFESLPVDYEDGIDFKLSKTKDGIYSNYTTSSWSRRTRALNEEERAAIEEHGLVDLKDYLPKKPNADELNAIVEMFEASVDGQLYDPDKWAMFYSPYGFDNSAYRQNSSSSDESTSTAPKTESAPAAKPAEQPKESAEAKDTVSDDIPWEEPAEAKDEKSAEPADTPKDDSDAKSESNDSGSSNPSADDILSMIRNRQQSKSD